MAKNIRYNFDDYNLRLGSSLHDYLVSNKKSIQLSSAKNFHKLSSNNAYGPKLENLLAS